MTFTVGRISKCTLKLQLLVFLFCSPEVGLSCHVKCAGVLVPCPNLRVSAKRPIVHFGDEGRNTLNRDELGRLCIHQRRARRNLAAGRCTSAQAPWCGGVQKDCALEQSSSDKRVNTVAKSAAKKTPILGLPKWFPTLVLTESYACRR
jgi:hypothetical protein